MRTQGTSCHIRVVCDSLPRARRNKLKSRGVGATGGEYGQMRVLLALLLLAVCVRGWKQCGPPSARVVKITSVDVVAEPRGSAHHVTVTVSGSAGVTVPADAVLRASARLGAIRVPLDDRQLGARLGPGEFVYVYEETFDAPPGIDVFVKLTVADGDREFVCLRDLEVKL